MKYMKESMEKRLLLVQRLLEKEKFEESFKIAHTMAEDGYAIAMTHVGGCYMVGSGIEEDTIKGVEWYKKAYDTGHPEGLSALGWATFMGSGVEKDQITGLKMLKKSVVLGSDTGNKLLDLALMSLIEELT